MQSVGIVVSGDKEEPPLWNTAATGVRTEMKLVIDRVPCKQERSNTADQEQFTQ